MVYHDDVVHNAADTWPPFRLAYTALGLSLNITKTNMIKVLYQE